MAVYWLQECKMDALLSTIINKSCLHKSCFVCYFTFCWSSANLANDVGFCVVFVCPHWNTNNTNFIFIQQYSLSVHLLFKKILSGSFTLLSFFPHKGKWIFWVCITTDREKDPGSHTKTSQWVTQKPTSYSKKQKKWCANERQEVSEKKACPTAIWNKCRGTKFWSVYYSLLPEAFLFNVDF